VVVYGGAVHLSSAYILDQNGRQIFGYATSLQNETFGSINRKAPVICLTQEHGIIQVDDKLFNEIKIADLLFVFPVHSCLTCNLYKEYKTLEGKVISRL
jgi:D-serine deaminase-like pyridoxal phosphate-dependent protein